jgi:endonuclease/exonuclease/phosphatase family metal-dependent hydrolase
MMDRLCFTLARLCIWAAPLFCVPSGLFTQTLRVATVNVWSGHDYNIGWSVGEFEPDSLRELRFRLLVDELRRRSVDVAAIQEANPVCGYSRMLARELGFDEIHQAVNGGIKIFGVGIPTNFSEGIAILAHPRLRLKHRDVHKTAGVFGVHGDALSIHFGEVGLALLGKIVVESIPLILVNVHLATALPKSMTDTIRAWRSRGEITPDDSSVAVLEMETRRMTRIADLANLMAFLHERYGEVPVILMGDFNAEPSSDEISMVIHDHGYLDAFGGLPVQDHTWSPSRNPNIRYSFQPHYVDGTAKSLSDLLDASYDAQDRRVDYIFLNEFFEREDILAADVFLDEPSDGVFASDHFGVVATIDLSRVAKKTEPEYTFFSPISTSVVEGFPILTYDTDVGFGYGVKGFFLNLLGWSESFDVTLFNSVRIERWYRLVFSIPDFELRQGKTYPAAFDLVVDFDKYLQANLFPPGNASDPRKKETYIREPLEVGLIASRGFEPTLVGQAGVRYRCVNSFGFQQSGLASTIPPLSVGKSRALSVVTNVRYDSRDSYVNPQRGAVVQAECDLAAESVLSDFDWFRVSLQGQYFAVPFYPTTVFAARLSLQQNFGGSLPLWAQSSLGGNNTLRGYPIDRFVDKGMMLMNTEMRFPIFSRLKGVAFYDVGRVWKDAEDIDLRSFHSNPGIGFRYVMDTFVVRLDVGFGKETTGLYFNFGHAF